jgi:5-methylcytosine-specific restriction endonuclease McrA
VLCGTTIDLTVRGKGGQRKKACTKLCRPCRQDYSKYKATARQLALRDGAYCGLCAQRVDMSLSRVVDSKWCPSVDHVIPRALGGSHEADNLQLAHLYCNQVKSDLRGALP